MNITPNSPESLAWWRNLSINQQREVKDRHYPEISWCLIWRGHQWIDEMWEKEGKPEPQPLIPIDPKFLS